MEKCVNYLFALAHVCVCELSRAAVTVCVILSNF